MGSDMAGSIGTGARVNPGPSHVLTLGSCRPLGHSSAATARPARHSGVGTASRKVNMTGGSAMSLPPADS